MLFHFLEVTVKMYFKLSLNNVKKSFKDYAIYFFTVTFAVCIFYVFNSIESQSIMLDLSNEQKKAFASINTIMGGMSVFVAFIVGFLIIYTNNYLIKRRNKEFGLYLLLGMEKSVVSKMLFFETLFIGIISLAAGIGIGTIVSQGLSIVTGKLFEADVSNFQFVFSYAACKKTIISFAIVYLIVFIFNRRSIRKVKLIDLFNSLKKNEKIKIKNPAVSVIIFIISLILIGSAYYIVIKNGVAVFAGAVLIAMALGAAGTFLFFMSLSGFMLQLVRSNKKIYLKNLNMFSLRQINSKINTTFVSVSFICLMLFIAICSLGTGVTLSSNINRNLKELAPHNLTLWSYNDIDIEKTLKDNNFDFNKYVKDYDYYKEYIDNNFRFSSVFTEKERKSLDNYYPMHNDNNIPIIKLSNFKKEMKMLERDEVFLKDNEYTILTDIEDAYDSLDNIIKDNRQLTINGHKLYPAKVKYTKATFNNETLRNNICTIVVNDSVCDGLKYRDSFLNCSLNNTSEEVLSEISNNLDSISKKVGKYSFYFMSDVETRANIQGIGVMISYLAFYLGIIFLICAAVTIAIQQISEAEDNKYRYNLLRKIGVENSCINRCLFNQIGIYFLMPLVVAAIHSIVGLQIAKLVVNLLASGVSTFKLILVSVVFITVIYGSYFLTTYLCAKNTIKDKLTKVE